MEQQYLLKKLKMKEVAEKVASSNDGPNTGFN